MHSSMDHSAWEFWVKQLDLKAHPEGGYYREVYRADLQLAAEALPSSFKGDRAVCTAIYYLLGPGQYSTFHRIASDEIWHFYQGSSLRLLVLHPEGEMHEYRLGDAPQNNEVFQLVVPAGCWFAARPLQENDWALCGCTVAPGFDFADFELAKKQDLLALFPQHAKIIHEFSR